MTKNKTSVENDNPSQNFFLSYEYTQNKRSLTILQRCSVFPILMIIFKVLNIFPNIPYALSISFLVGWPVCLLLLRYLINKKPYASVTKYLIIACVEIACFILATSKGFKVYIIYMIAPLLSCLYLNKKFSLKITGACYVVMLISLYIRAFYINPQMGYTAEPVVWAKHMISTLSIGYLMNAVIIYVIGRRNQQIIDTDSKEVQKNLNSQNTLVTSYVALLCKKSENIEGHLRRSSKYVQVIVSGLRENRKFSMVLTPAYSYQIISGSFLHDIGIISVPNSILQSQTELTEKQRKIVMKHPEMGEKLLVENMRSVDPEYLAVATDMVLYHHENYDGTGYPFGRKGEEIPLAARIMAAGNILDNLLVGHPWKKGLDFDQALEEILQMAGKQLDPDIVEVVFEKSESLRYFYEEFKNKY